MVTYLPTSSRKNKPKKNVVFSFDTTQRWGSPIGRIGLCVVFVPHKGGGHRSGRLGIWIFDHDFDFGFFLGEDLQYGD